MRHFIDRRLNPKDKSLVNRQRFLRRARAQIKDAVNKSLKDRKITDVGGGESVSIPTKGIREPRLRHASSGGRRERIFPGNKEFVSRMTDRGYTERQVRRLVEWYMRVNKAG